MVRDDRVMKGAVIFLVFLNVLYLQITVAQGKRTQFLMQKLCSRKLSDALYVVCQERGYNEPFSYSNENEPRADPGPGLVEECCYHQCTYEQLEQYCKPEEKRIDSRDDVIDQSYIANLPHSTTTDLLEQHPQTGMDYAGDAIKRFTQQR